MSNAVKGRSEPSVIPLHSSRRDADVTISVSEKELLAVGQRVTACKRLVKELEKSPKRFATAGAEELRLARKQLRGAEYELRQLKDAGQLRLLDAPLREKAGKRK